MARWLQLCAVVVVACLGGVGCAHTVLIDPEPKYARVYVDGELQGVGPQSIERRVIVGDHLRIEVQADGYEDATLSVPASEWYPYPGLLALVPLLGIPIGISVTILGLPLLGVGLILGPLVAVGWAVVTSPTIAALAFTRKYPDTVKIKLTRRRSPADGLGLPSDLFDVPDDLGPNPNPDVGPLPGASSTPSSTSTPTPTKPPQTGGGNPIP